MVNVAYFLISSVRQQGETQSMQNHCSYLLHTYNTHDIVLQKMVSKASCILLQDKISAENVRKPTCVCTHGGFINTDNYVQSISE